MKKLKYLYLHFPFCRHLCNYCDFYKKLKTDSQGYSEFHKLFQRQWDKHEKIMKDNGYEWSELETLYIGGGTPSLWGEEGAIFLKNFFKEKGITLAKNGEFTLEVNPGSWSENGLNAWRELGMNRFSLGIQSLNSEYLKILDRVHSLDDVYQTLDHFNKMKLNFSVDFMLGLPDSEKRNRNILKELDEILAFSPEHISLYILTAKGAYPFKDQLPEDDFLANEYLSVSEKLISAGFTHYEVSNFAKPNKASVHNIAYWKSKSVAAVGPSASGLFFENQIRYKWKVSSDEVEIEKMSDESMLIEKVYMGLRINEGLSLEVFDNKEIINLAKKWQSQGLCTIDSGHLRLNSRGFLVLDDLMGQMFSQKII